MNLKQYFGRFWIGYSFVLGVSFLLAILERQQSFLSLIVPMIGIVLLSFVLSIPAYFNCIIWVSCISFFVIVAAFSVLRFLLYGDDIAHALGIVFFVWSIFLGFFVGAFFEALVRLARYAQKRRMRPHHRREQKKKRHR